MRVIAVAVLAIVVAATLAQAATITQKVYGNTDATCTAAAIKSTDVAAVGPSAAISSASCIQSIDSTTVWIKLRCLNATHYDGESFSDKACATKTGSFTEKLDKCKKQRTGSYYEKVVGCASTGGPGGSSAGSVSSFIMVVLAIVGALMM